MGVTLEQGNGWELERGFIAPEEAQLIGEQALLLIEDAIELLNVYDEERQPAFHGVTAYEASYWYSPDWPLNPYNDYRERVAPDLFALAELMLVSRPWEAEDLIALNVFEPGGYIDPHEDFEGICLDVVGLIGARKFAVRDLVTDRLHPFDLLPGDRMRVDSRHGAPTHFAVNPSQTDGCLSMVK
jgi:hypothetical protein